MLMSNDLTLTSTIHMQRWKGNCDFHKAATVNAVQLQFNSIDKLLKKECSDKNKLKEVKKSCRTFFVEMVSELCFRGEGVLETALVKSLLDTVFTVTDVQSTVEQKPNKEGKVTAVQSFMLQLLLQHRYFIIIPWLSIVFIHILLQHGSSKGSPERPCG